MRRQRGQSTLEYAVLIAVVMVAILGVQHYVRRAVEGRSKLSADQIGEQWSTADSKYAIAVKSTGARREELKTSGESNSTLVKDEEQSRNASDYQVGVAGSVRDGLFK